MSTLSSTWGSLPCESLALIASYLEAPDRACLASTCTAGRQAASISARTLMVSGNQLLLASAELPSSSPATHLDSPSSPTSSSPCWDCACCADECAPHSCNTPKERPTTDVSGAPELAPCSWLQRYSGVRSLTVAGCDDCQPVPAGSCLQMMPPGSPHTPLFASDGSFLSGSSSSHMYLDSTCLSINCSGGSHQGPSQAQLPRVSLATFLAAAGSSMPYLQELDISACCPCLHSSAAAAAPSGVLAAIVASCPRLSKLSMPTWLLQSGLKQQQQQRGSGAFHTLPGGSNGSSLSIFGPSAASVAAAAAAWDPAVAAAAAAAVAAYETEDGFGLGRLLLHAPQHNRLHAAAGAAGVGGRGSRSAPSSPPGWLSALPSLRVTRPQIQAPQQQQQQQWWVQSEHEQVSALAGLCRLTSLKLCGAAPPRRAVLQLAQLTQLQSFTLQVSDVAASIPAALSELPGWQGSAAGGAATSTSDSGAAGRVSASSSGAVLGASLAALTGLTCLSLSGVLHAADTLKALSALPALARVELADLSDFAVASLASLSGLTGLTALRVRGCRALQATARSALPLQLHALQDLAVLDLDFDLHLRDMQVLCLLKRLSDLTANSFHHCIHLMATLCLPSLKVLRISNVSRFALQPRQQQPQQQPQQQAQQPGQQLAGLPAALQLAQALAGGPNAAAAAAIAAALPAAGAVVAAAAAAPPAAAAGLGEAVHGDLGAAAGAPPIVALSALPVLVNLQQQQQQQQDEQLPPFLLVAAPGATALLVHQQQQQQPGTASAAAAQQAAQGIQQQQQQVGLPNGLGVQLLQLRQQQLYLQHQQLRLQQQQVRLQLQQMQAQLVHQVQQAPQHAAWQGPPAAGPPPPPQQQQQQQQAGNDVAAAAAALAAPAPAGCVQGWLTVMFPGLEELHLTAATECGVALPALQGHRVLQRLVIGSPKTPSQQQRVQLGGWQGAVSAAGGGAAAAGFAGAGVDGTRPPGCGARSSKGVSAPWGLLRSLPCLEELVIYDTASVLGSTPWPLGTALAGQLRRLVLKGASSLSDLPTATLLGPYSWQRLVHLEIEGAQSLGDCGLKCLSSLPVLQRLRIGHCPRISACGLASFLLSGSGSLRHVDLLCCAGVKPAEAQAVQDAVWGLTRRRIELSWSRHDTGRP